MKIKSKLKKNSTFRLVYRGLALTLVAFFLTQQAFPSSAFARQVLTNPREGQAPTTDPLATPKSGTSPTETNTTEFLMKSPISQVEADLVVTGSSAIKLIVEDQAPGESNIQVDKDEAVTFSQESDEPNIWEVNVKDENGSEFTFQLDGSDLIFSIKEIEKLFLQVFGYALTYSFVFTVSATSSDDEGSPAVVSRSFSVTETPPEGNDPDAPVNVTITPLDPAMQTRGWNAGYYIPEVLQESKFISPAKPEEEQEKAEIRTFNDIQASRKAKEKERKGSKNQSEQAVKKGDLDEEVMGYAVPAALTANLSAFTEPVLERASDVLVSVNSDLILGPTASILMMLMPKNALLGPSQERISINLLELLMRSSRKVLSPAAEQVNDAAVKTLPVNPPPED